MESHFEAKSLEEIAMDLLKSLLQEKGADMVGELVNKAGFGQQQAESFVPEAMGSVLDTVQGSGMNPAELLQNPSALLGKMDILALASKVGVGDDQARSGLTTLLPLVTSFLGSKAGGLGALASLMGNAGGGGGLAGAIGGLAGGLLGKK